MERWGRVRDDLNGNPFVYLGYIYEVGQRALVGGERTKDGYMCSFISAALLMDDIRTQEYSVCPFLSASL
jgi:hypothetical protein